MGGRSLGGSDAAPAEATNEIYYKIITDAAVFQATEQNPNSNNLLRAKISQENVETENTKKQIQMAEGFQTEAESARLQADIASKRGSETPDTTNEESDEDAEEANPNNRMWLPTSPRRYLEQPRSRKRPPLHPPQ